jgi:hypothetical protein
MSATEIMRKLPRLGEADRKRALEIKARIDALEAELEKLLARTAVDRPALELRDRGISESQAADLRDRLKTFC